MKKLKWRLTAGAKAVWGGVSIGNTPGLTEGDGIFNYPTRLQVDKDGNAVLDQFGNEKYEQVTFTLEKVPYAEASIGVENIFKLLSVQVVKRFTHLDNPNVAQLGKAKGWGFRMRVGIRF